MMRLSLALFVSTSAALLALALPRIAAATETFPAAMRTDLSLDYEPCCTVCHETESGGAGTVTKIFGLALQDRGLEPNDESSLAGALGQLKTDAFDSDEDGKTDVDELAAQTDPNGTGALDACGGSPLYGCGAHAQLASAEPVWEGAAAIATAAALLATRRRRRRG